MNKYCAIGLMSGTSLDGLDICYASFQKNKRWNFEILKAETLPYSTILEEQLCNAIHLGAEDLLALNAEYGFYLGKNVQDFIKTNKIEKLHVIASHGHTVFHQPGRKFTTQIGDGRAIKIQNPDIPVVYDFRTQDVLLGGNGAPLVPIGDEMLFSEYDACINLGGFSNISFQHGGKRMAFDICPVNIVQNPLARQLGKSYDENGNFARQGILSSEVLKQLDDLDFYQQNVPRSLGIEWVNRNIAPLMASLQPVEALATFNQHIANQIALVLERFNLKKVLFTGGGSYNSYLMATIKSQTNAELIIPQKEIIEFKEALIFAFMGVLKLRGEINVLASATGSAHDHCSGLLV